MGYVVLMFHRIVPRRRLVALRVLEWGMKGSWSTLALPVSVGLFVALTTASQPVCVSLVFKKFQKILSFLCMAARPGS